MADDAPESTPTRAYSAELTAELRREWLTALGNRPDAPPDARGYHDAARRLAETLEGEALRHAKVLEVLDLGRARACRAAAAAARDAQNRFRGWLKWDPPIVQRQHDLAIWSEALRTACALGIDLPPASLREPGGRRSAPGSAAPSPSGTRRSS